MATSTAPSFKYIHPFSCFGINRWWFYINKIWTLPTLKWLSCCIYLVPSAKIYIINHIIITRYTFNTYFIQPKVSTICSQMLVLNRPCFIDYLVKNWLTKICTNALISCISFLWIRLQYGKNLQRYILRHLRPYNRSILATHITFHNINQHFDMYNLPHVITIQWSPLNNLAVVTALPTSAKKWNYNYNMGKTENYFFYFIKYPTVTTQICLSMSNFSTASANYMFINQTRYWKPPREFKHADNIETNCLYYTLHCTVSSNGTTPTGPASYDCRFSVIFPASRSILNHSQ